MKHLISRNRLLSSYIDEKLPVVFQAVLASLLMALCAQIQVPIPFTPVPITIQTLAVMLLGVTLGSRKGSLAMAFYLIQGSLGAPVWAGGGAGFARLLSPVGGYLMAYLLQVYIIGYFVEKRERKSLSLFSFLLLSICVQLGIGSLWLSLFVGVKSCLALGFYPFIAGEIAKAFFVLCYVRLQKMNKKGGVK